MKKIACYLICVFIFIIIFFCSQKAFAASQHDVVFSELMWMGSSVSSSDEWVELYNNTSQNIDLSGWQITKLGDSGEELMLMIPSGIIPANGYFLISNNEKDHQFSGGESILNIEPDLVSSTVSLSNSKFQLKLYDGQYDKEYNLIDVAGDENDPNDFAGNNSTPKASMYRSNLTSDGAIKTNWQATASQKNLDTGAIELATPQSSGKPIIEYLKVDKTQIDKTKNEQVVFSAKISDPDDLEDISIVKIDLSQIRANSSLENMCDEASCGDSSSSDGVYTYTFAVKMNDNCENHKVIIQAIDTKGLSTIAAVSLDIIQTSSQIRINEILPKPASGTQDEYIEIYNFGDIDVNLYKWQLDDKINSGANPYTMNERRTIKAGQYQVFYKTETGLTLNDSGDFVRLISPAFIELQSIEYPKTTGKDQSYSFADDNWIWSTILTPGFENTISEINTLGNTEINTENDQNNQSSKENSKETSISKIKTYEAETYVKLVGVVTAAPNQLAKTYFYIQDESGGTQVYSYYKDFPDLKIGDKIQVIGRISSSKDRRIKIDNAVDVILLGRNNIIEPGHFWQKPNYLDYEGVLVEIKGNIVQTSGDTFYIQDLWGEIIKVYIQKMTGINKPRMFKGDTAKIIGIVDITKDGFQILPVLQNHVEIINPFNSENVETENKNKSNSLISTAHAASSDQVFGLSKKNKYLQDLNHQNISSSWKNIIKIIVIACSLLMVYIIGDYLWKNRIRLKT